jgi:uncharacterized membrane protein
MTRVSVGARSDRARTTEPDRIFSWRRLLLSLAMGAVSAAVTALLGAGDLAVLLGWTVAAGVLLFWVWRFCWPQDAAGTKRADEYEGETRVTDSEVLVAAVASLAAVVVAIVRSGSKDAGAIAAVVLGLVVVMLSWALMNTVFALKYARLYYAGDDGGIEFQQDAPPAYSDFAYVAFSVGMSFAPPETALTWGPIRKVGLGHALLSYLFTTVLFAVVINLVTNLGPG